MSVDVTETNNTVVVSSTGSPTANVTPNPNEVVVDVRPPNEVTTGPAVGPFATYTHSQASPSASWTITHNLKCKPSVTVVDSAGHVQIGDILYVSDNQIIITFAIAFGGYAFLN